jgi:hypothetical protein
MRYSVGLCFAVLASWSAACTVSAFTTSGVQSAAFKQSAPSSVSLSSSDSTSEEPQQPPRPPNMVDQALFQDSIKTLRAEAAKANGMDPPPEPEEEPSYAIGKVMINIPIASLPGLGLTESTGLVLVSALAPATAEMGIQPLDTIVGAASGTFKESTKALSLDETAGTLMACAAHAMENGMEDIEIEVNRLIMIRYADE